MWSYVVTHWRGKLSLGISFFLNALLAYVILVSLIMGLDRLVPGGFPVWLGMTIFALWFVWAIVGTVRCALRALRENTYGRRPSPAWSSC